MSMSPRHKEVEAEFVKLDDELRTPENYVSHCRAAKIAETAIENRLSALALFKRVAPKKPAKVMKPVGKPEREPESKHDETTRDGREAAARERVEQRRRAWQAEYEPVGDDEADESEKKK